MNKKFVANITLDDLYNYLQSNINYDLEDNEDEDIIGVSNKNKVLKI